MSCRVRHGPVPARVGIVIGIVLRDYLVRAGELRNLLREREAGNDFSSALFSFESRRGNAARERLNVFVSGNGGR